MSKKKKKKNYYSKISKKKKKKKYPINKKKNINKNINSKKQILDKKIEKNIKTLEKNIKGDKLDKREIKTNLPKEKKHKNSIIKNTFLILIICIIILIFPMMFFINKNISLTLIGNESETIEVFSEYNDPGYNATIFKSNINNKIKTESNLDTNKLGTYTITYKLPYLNTHKVTRKINVVDTTKPTLKLNGKESISLYVGDTYKEEGATATDNYDKDLTSNITIDSNLDTKKKGTYKITYTVKDSSNNESSITRTINIKNKPTYMKSCNTSNPIDRYICENNYKVSVGYYNLTNNNTYYYNKNNTYYGASLIKTLDALYLYDHNMINDDLKNYVKKAITVSDNPSHHYLVNYIGKNNLIQYGKSLGATYTLVGGDNFGTATVSDQIAYMKRLYSITKDGQNEELKSFFLNTRKNALLFDNSPLIMHKYGHWEQVYHNSGIILDEHPYIVTIITKEGYNNYNKIISTISKLVYEYHQEQSY